MRGSLHGAMQKDSLSNEPRAVEPKLVVSIVSLAVKHARVRLDLVRRE